METQNGYQISGSWTDLNTLTGVAIGEQLLINNMGRAGDLIEVTVSALEPAESFRGIAIKSLDPQYRVAPQEAPVWARYIRYDLNGTITPEDARTCLAGVQSLSDIEEAASLPSSLIDTGRVKTVSATVQEYAIIEGRFFTGASARTGVTILDTPYDTVITAGANGLVIDDLIISLDFSNTSDGQFSYTFNAYVDQSNGNTWSYTPIVPTPIGRPLNAGFINDLPLSTIQGDVSATVTGTPDYAIYFADYYVDTSGNRNDESIVDNNFFAAGRQIVLPPGSEILVRATITGDATGSVDIKSLFFGSETG